MIVGETEKACTGRAKNPAAMDYGQLTHLVGAKCDSRLEHLKQVMPVGQEEAMAS